MPTIFLKGIMTAEEPLTVTHKGAQDGPRHRLPRLGKRENAPAYYPASNIRGAIRHAIHEELIDVAANEGQPLDLAQQFMLAQGVDISGLLNDEPTEGVINPHRELRTKNPAISLLGRWKLQTQMDIGNAYPIVQDATAYYAEGARIIMYERNPELVDTLKPDQQERLLTVLANQALASTSKAEIKAQIKDLLKKRKTTSDHEKKFLNQEIEALQELEKKFNTGEKGEGSSGIRRPLDGCEAFNKGISFDHRAALVNVEDVAIGIFLAGLRRFVRYPYLGAKQAYNFGLVSFAWTVSRYRSDEDLSPSEIGSIQLSLDAGLQIQSEAGYLENCLAKWDEMKKDLKSHGIDIRKMI